jgi:hypothetical protein
MNQSTSWQKELFGDILVTKTGLQDTNEVLRDKLFVGLYFGAHWVRIFACSIQLIIVNAFYYSVHHVKVLVPS